jgi:hypothetical protein
MDVAVSQRNLAACFQYVQLQPATRHLLYMLVKACAARADFTAARDAFDMHAAAGLTPGSNTNLLKSTPDWCIEKLSR